MLRIKNVFFVILMFAVVLAACSAQPTQAQPPTEGGQIGEPASTQSTTNLPQSEAAVPRISVEEARAALESGEAIMVDVRTPGAFEESHIAGAVSVPLGAIERDLTNVPLSKEQWIITYCT
jgi:3-mercaptopyruvate sulfurtransferase SseA